MENEHAYMKVVERAIGQMSEETPLSEAIAEICEKEQIEPEEFGEWIKSFKGLLQVIEINAKNHKLLNKNNVFESISMSEYF